MWTVPITIRAKKSTVSCQFDCVLSQERRPPGPTTPDLKRQRTQRGPRETAPSPHWTSADGHGVAGPPSSALTGLFDSDKPTDSRHDRSTLGIFLSFFFGISSPTTFTCVLLFFSETCFYIDFRDLLRYLFDSSSSLH